MKIKQKLIDAKNSVVDYGREHKDFLFSIVIGSAYLAGCVAASKAIDNSIQNIAENTSKGSIEIDGKEYNISEERDFTPVEELDEL